VSDDYRDQELADSIELAAQLLRTIADRWRFRARAGRLGHHPLDETLRLVGTLEAAIATLTDGGDEAARNVPRFDADEERFRQLVDSVTDYAIFMLDVDGRVASWNAGAERIEGYRAEEIIGKHFSIFYPPEEIDRDKPSRELDVAAREGRYIDEDWRLRKDGGRFWAHVTITALRDAENRLTGYVKVTRDVTDLRNATEALRQSEERFRVMVEAVRDYAIFMLDVDGHIASWNVGAERLKGYRSDEIIGQHFSIFYSDEDRQRQHPQEELRRAKAEGRYEEEGWRYRKDGSRFWANVVITALFDDEGHHIGFTKVTRDFTETRRLREAQLAVQVRDEFLAIAGHELRTPLTALLLQINSLVRNVPTDGARLKQRLEKAALAGERLAALIGQMLDVSRITAGRLRLDHERVEIDELVREVAERFSELARESGCALVLRLEPVVGTWDRVRVDQVISNLIGNAVKYGRGQPVEVELRRDGSDVVLRVIDHGIGISADDQQKIFERFERAAGTREYGGFGLGLWISRQIVEASHGTIDVASEPGRGATFTVRLPLEAAP